MARDKENNKDFIRSYLTPSGFEALRRGHPWLRNSDIKKDFPLPRTPCVYPLGEHWFLYSPQSKIPFRRLGPTLPFWPNPSSKRTPIFDPRDFNDLFGKPLKSLLEERYFYKKTLLSPETCFRWIFSENDFIPGLIVDLYDRTAVVQMQSEALEVFWKPIEAAFHEIKNSLKFFDRLHRSRPAHTPLVKDGTFQTASDLSDLADLGENTMPRQEIQWNGLRWKMQPGGHQKTGSYLDQRENHLKALRWAQTLQIPTAWDLFCFEGGFGLHLAKKGIEVLAVDQSEEAIEIALANRDLNGISPKTYQADTQDVFEFLKGQIERNQKTKMILLDPPSFARSETQRQAGLRGLYELHSLALQCLEPHSLLVSCSCSHAITRQDFLKILSEVSHRYRRPFHLLETSGASADHGWTLPFFQGEYLQSWFLSIGASGT